MPDEWTDTPIAAEPPLTNGKSEQMNYTVKDAIKKHFRSEDLSKRGNLLVTVMASHNIGACSGHSPIMAC